MPLFPILLNCLFIEYVLDALLALGNFSEFFWAKNNVQYAFIPLNQSCLLYTSNIFGTVYDESDSSNIRLVLLTKDRKVMLYGSGF